MLLFNADISRKLRTTRPWYWSKKTLIHKAEAFDPQLAGIKNLTLPRAVENAHLAEVPLDSHFLSYAQTFETKLLAQLLQLLNNASGEWSFQQAHFHWWQQLPPTFLATSTKRNRSISFGVCLVLSSRAGYLHVRTEGRTQCSLENKFACIIRRDVQKKWEKLFLCAQLKLFNSLPSKTQAGKRISTF